MPSPIIDANQDSNQFKLDVQDALEHVIAIGSSIQHDFARYGDWRIRRQPTLMWQHVYGTSSSNGGIMDEEEEEETDHPPSRRQRQQRRQQQLHAEDVRIYGSNGIPREPWPQVQHRKRQGIDNDEQWQIEHGDNIDLVTFSIEKLSQMPAMSEDDNVVNGRNRSFVEREGKESSMDQNRNGTVGEGKEGRATDGANLTSNQLSRDLLLRCWERAVHAMACTPLAPTTTITKKTNVPTLDRVQANSRVSHAAENNTSNNIDQSTDYSSSTARKKCKEWKCELPSREDVPTTTSAQQQQQSQTHHCPDCHLEYDTIEQLQSHYYGNDAYQQLGCCWNVIRTKQRSLIDQILQRHIQLQMDQFIEIVLSQASQNCINTNRTIPFGRRNGNCNNNSRKRQRLLNWYDILQFTKTTIGSSIPMRLPMNSMEDTQETVDHHQQQQQHNSTAITDLNHPILETLQVQHDKYPLVLNQSIVQAVERRLLDRYANVPY